MSSEMVPLPATAGESSDLPLVNPFGGSARRQYSSLPLQTIEDRQQFYLLQMMDTEGLADVVNLTIEVRGVVVQEWTKEELSGEVQEMFRMILVTADGRMIGTSSKGARRSLAVYCQTFGMPTDWKSPVPFLVKQKPLPPAPGSDTPRFTYDLIAQFALPSAGGKGKAKP